MVKELSLLLARRKEHWIEVDCLEELEEDLTDG